MNLDQAIETYILESRDLLEEMETALLAMENGPASSEAVNAVFRAAHTIKGSAGLFGLDRIVAFTHRVESVLDRIRAGHIQLDGGLIALLLQCGDHMRGLIDGLTTTDPAIPPNAVEHELANRLDGYLGSKPLPHAPPIATSAAPEAPLPQTPGKEPLAASDCWHISLRFGSNVLRNGMDPMGFLNYLATFGEIVHIETLTDGIPQALEMDPETCYLGFEINFRTDADKAKIENAFEFVRDDCVVRILPPRAKISEYLALIRELGGQTPRLGELLVRSGALTPLELERGLALQDADSPQSTSGGRRPIGEILMDQGVVTAAIVDEALESQRTKIPETAHLRVDAGRLDQLIDLVGELVIACAGNSLRAARTKDAALLEAAGEVTRLVEEVRDAALQLRMVAVGTTFNRFQRVVRDVAADLGKDIGLVISGGDTEVDKSVVEKIGDPLLHLVRNAMDHGIEPVATRLERGKEARGTLHLNAFHESGNIVIEVSDDGGGLNRDKILAKAIANGVVDRGQHLTDKEIFELIFVPGFSTADSITNLSGRGVGMDVVKRNIQALRGTIEIDSQEGLGTTIRIRLPLTLAIIDGFLVGVGKNSFVVPLERVVECIELAPEVAEERHDYINLRGEVLPFVRLRQLFRLTGQPKVKRENIVVVEHGGNKCGLVVDALMGEFQTVIKPLGKLFAHVHGVSGSTILGNGEVTLILDVGAILEEATRRAHSAGKPEHLAVA